MKVLRIFRETLARLLLRGRILRCWVSRKVKKLETQYVRELVTRSQSPAPTESRPKPVSPGTPLKRILFIGQILWEDTQLIPELEKIAAVSVLDLKNVAASPTRSRSEAACQTLERFIGEHQDMRPDIVLFYADSTLLSNDAFQLLRGTWAAPIIGMNLDEKIQFLDYGLFSRGADNYERWAPRFDFNLSNSLAVCDWYRRLGLPSHYMPEGTRSQPMPQVDAGGRDFKWNVSFVGSRKPEREAFIENLQAKGIQVDLFGQGWSHSQWQDDTREIFTHSRINLGLGFASPSTKLTTLKGRDFECPGAGGCYATTFNWELPLHFDIGREILCYQSLEELVELICWHRQRPELCRQIGLRAHARCQRDHTWEKRFRPVFQSLGFAS